MGFNKKILPPLDEFKERLRENPSLLEQLSKADAILGPIETITYLKQLWNNTPESIEKAKVINENSSLFEF
jgi:hypothetical protein